MNRSYTGPRRANPSILTLRGAETYDPSHGGAGKERPPVWVVVTVGCAEKVFLM